MISFLGKKLLLVVLAMSFRFVRRRLKKRSEPSQTRGPVSAKDAAHAAHSARQKEKT